MSELDAAQVAAYLREHPDFLRQHPETLAAIDVPHETGDAVSLLEYQVQVLRERQAATQQRLEQLQETAHHNEQRLAGLDSLACLMAGAESADTMLEAMGHCLRDRLAVPAFYVGLRAEAPLDTARLQMLTPDSTAEQVLSRAFRQGRANCGELSREQAAALFADTDCPALQSAAFMPLGEDRQAGMAVLASADPQRFTADMGGVFLDLLSHMLTASLHRLLGAASPLAEREHG